jgi:outer membrane receptor protein involved in Fe transport
MLLRPLVGSAAADTAPTVPASDEAVEQITVTAERLGLIGEATTSSQGIVTSVELSLTPAFRPGQLLETVPGLVVTSHSGEGKANQYLMRGFNLDHGTDLATFVDGMPVNAPTHAHGQGYTDLNFLIPELTSGLTFTKGPYFAEQGDFASIGSVAVSYRNTIDDQLALTAGTLGFRRLLGSGSTALGAGNVLGAIELQHYDGPWDSPDDQRKVNALVRYSAGGDSKGYSLTGMFYHGLWNATTDQPVRAVQDGLISRFGSLDPSDGGEAQRASLSGQYHASIADGQLTASAYAVSNHLTLWNNFTHFLNDPVNGDQEAQHEDRTVLGGAIGYARALTLHGVDNHLITGLQIREDSVDVSRLPTAERVVLPPTANPLSFSESDRVHLSSVGVFAQAGTQWLPWFRSVVGLRVDDVHEHVSGSNAGSDGQSLFQPKGSLIFTPTDTTELYVSAGRGFHTDDARGVNLARVIGQSGAPLIASTTGQEVGVRQQFGQQLAATLTVFRIDFRSETTYDPDAGQDSAGPPSRRNGAELNLTWQARRWLEFYTSIAATHARYTEPYDDGTGHIGTYIADAPNVIGSFATYVKALGPWSGGLEFRYFGAHPLTPDNAVRGDGYGEWNTDVHYAFASGWSLGLGLYNLLDEHANAAEFWYVDRLAGEAPEGVAGLHIHPLEPRSVRITIAMTR